MRTRDNAKAERTHERQVRRHRADVDMAAGYLSNGEEVPERLSSRGTIIAWSPKSRARLVARLSDLDYSRLYGRYRTCTGCGRDFDFEALLPRMQGDQLGGDRPQQPAAGDGHPDLSR